MKLALTLFAIAFVYVVLCSEPIIPAKGDPLEGLSEAHAFEQFVSTYRKNYSAKEFARRFQIFKENIERIKELNILDPYAVYGITQFSDLTPEEFKDKYLIKNFTSPQLDTYEVFQAPNNVSLPSSFDWKSKGVVSAVYNQGACGSCWAFSVTEHIESMWAIAGRGLNKLAMQQLVDCDTYDHGCNGGFPENAYKYILNAGGLDSYTSYPYTGKGARCAFKPASVTARITKWGYVTQSRDENAIANWVNSYGPPSVCVDASTWQNYRSGVVSTCGKTINHCVQITGFQVMNNVNVWNVRNSWGTTWGMQGYMYIKRGGDICRIASEVTAASV